MERAIELAKECFDEGEVPVGAVIVKDEKITGEGKNKVIFENDVTSHAEINAISQFFSKYQEPKISQLIA